MGQTRFLMNLPGAAATGEHLTLQFLGLSTTSAPTSLGTPEQTPVPRFLLQGATESVAIQLVLSPAAKVLSDIQQQTIGVETLKAGIIQNADSLAIAAHMPVATVQIAQSLESMVRNSGLFYESHLASWVAGRLPLAAILTEPQALLSSFPSLLSTPGLAQAIAQTELPLILQTTGNAPGLQSMAEAPTATQIETTTATTQQTSNLRQSKVTDAATNASVRPYGTQAANNAFGGRITDIYQQMAELESVASPQTAQNLPTGLQMLSGPMTSLIGQQLQVLTHQQVAWTGSLWPGQAAQLVVEKAERREDEAPQSPSHEDEQAHWVSTITLQLPQMGTVSARMAITGNDLVLHIQGTEYATLDAGRLKLESALGAAGLHVTQCSVSPMEEEPL
jgi:hypothetical protein